MKRLARDRLVPLGQRYQVMAPALTIDPGETIVVATINHMTPVVWGVDDLHAHGSPEFRERQETGPISVRGVQPGEMLAVHIEDIQFVGLPHAHAAHHPMEDRYPQEPMVFPLVNGRCQLPGRVSVPVMPMIGDIYTIPETPLFFDQGGNMDFTEVKPGNTLYLPVFRDGGLLVLGDVHAAQGDGEIYSEGAECAADVTITVRVDRTYRSPRPVVETPDHLFCLAGRASMWDSLKLALDDMAQLLSRVYGLSEKDAYVLCSLIGSARFAGSLAIEEWLANRALLALGVPKDLRIESRD